MRLVPSSGNSAFRRPARDDAGWRKQGWNVRALPACRGGAACLRRQASHLRFRADFWPGRAGKRAWRGTDPRIGIRARGARRDMSRQRACDQLTLDTHSPTINTQSDQHSDPNALHHLHIKRPAESQIRATSILLRRSWHHHLRWQSKLPEDIQTKPDNQ